MIEIGRIKFEDLKPIPCRWECNGTSFGQIFYVIVIDFDFDWPCGGHVRFDVNFTNAVLEFPHVVLGCIVARYEQLNKRYHGHVDDDTIHFAIDLDDILENHQLDSDPAKWTEAECLIVRMALS